MKKIIFFGSERDINLFIRHLAVFFKKKDYKIILLTHNIYHRNKWNDFNKKNEYCDVLDITKLSLKEIVSVIKNITPASIILTNYESLMNYIIIRVANILSIKTIFLQHGIFGEKIEKLSGVTKIQSIYSYYIYISLFYQFRNYKDNIIHLSRILYDIIIKRNLREYYNFSHAVVYSKSDLLFIMNNFNIVKKNVTLSGYPIFNSINENNEFFEHKIEIKKNKKLILFLHQPLNGFSSKFSYKKELAYYNKVQKICKGNGFDFIIKLHQRTDKDFYLNNSYSKELNIVQNVNLLSLIKKSSVVIGLYSSAFYYAILMETPIIQIFYPFSEYPLCQFDEVSIKVNSYDELDDVLSNNARLYSKVNLYGNFVEKFIGFGNSFESLTSKLIKISC